MQQPRSVRLGESIAGFVRRVLPAPLTRLAYRAGYVLLSLWWMISHPTSNGSKVVVTRGEEVLFVRLTYGPRNTWDLPGGTANDGETPERTAARELREELGLAGALEPVGQWETGGRGRQGTLHAFRLEVEPSTEPVIDEIEIAEARWFGRDDLPARIAKGGDLILKSLLGKI